MKNIGTQLAALGTRKLSIIATLTVVGVCSIWFWFSYSAAEVTPPIYGNVDIRDVSVAFRVAGRVQEVLVDEGDRVESGQLLAKLDTAPLANTVAASEALLSSATAKNEIMHHGYRAEDIAQANARLAGAKAARAEAELQLTRLETMVPSGAAAQRALDNARSVRDQAVATMASAEAQVQQYRTGYRKEEIAESDAALAHAKANLETARLALADAYLTAPSEGIVLTRAVEKGAMVQVGTPAFNLSLIKPVWVRAYVPEPQLGHFSAATTVKVFTDTRPGKPYRGVVGFVSPTSEFTPKSVETPDLRTSLVYRIRVVVKDPDAQLRQGMPVTIKRD